MRKFGVEEELLVVDAVTLMPAPLGGLVVERFGGATDTGHYLSTELKQEQLEVSSPPQGSTEDQLSAIRAGRAIADRATSTLGARVLALPLVPGPHGTTLGNEDRYRAIGEKFGLTTIEQLSCGFHIHVEIDSAEEGVAVLDRIRIWLPALLALSASSPFWRGVDTGYASYRYQAWCRWPTTGPTPVFGSVGGYRRHCQELLDSRVPLDSGMLYFDARLSTHAPTVEVRVADVCMSDERATVIAALVRALVETAARQWQAGHEAARVGAAALRTWMWQASHSGVEADLVDPLTGAPAPAATVIGRLLEILRPVLNDYGETTLIERVVADILGTGSGARLQRTVYHSTGEVLSVARHALEASHATQ